MPCKNEDQSYNPGEKTVEAKLIERALKNRPEKHFQSNVSHHESRKKSRNDGYKRYTIVSHMVHLKDRGSQHSRYEKQKGKDA